MSKHNSTDRERFNAGKIRYLHEQVPQRKYAIRESEHYLLQVVNAVDAELLETPKPELKPAPLRVALNAIVDHEPAQPRVESLEPTPVAPEIKAAADQLQAAETDPYLTAVPSTEDTIIGTDTVSELSPEAWVEQIRREVRDS